MATKRHHLWKARGHKYRDNDYDNDIQNNLSPDKSIEDNELLPNIREPNIRENSEERNVRRQTSLYIFEKNLEALKKKIHERLACDDKGADKARNNSSSETEKKCVYTDPKSTPIGTSDTGIYTSYLQEGDGNFMLVCEPKGTMKNTCCKQVGNNNIMVNLRMSMLSNSCQILDEEGKVFQIDTAGEVWLEIRKHRRGSSSESSSTRSSNSSDISSDSNNAPGVNGLHSTHSFNQYEDEIVRMPTEHSDRGPVTYSEVTKSPYIEPRWPLNNWHRTPDENFDPFFSYLRDKSVGEEKIRICEKDDAIYMKVETPLGSTRLSEYACIETCEPVQTALKHQKVQEFLQNQKNDFDFDVSVVGWEYEREQIYSYVKDTSERTDDVNPYSTCPDPLKRTPTLPPRRHTQLSPSTEDITPLLRRIETEERYHSINDLNAERNEPPALPSRGYLKEPCEGSIEDSSESSPSELSFQTCTDTSKPPALPARNYLMEPCEQSMDGSVELTEHTCSDTATKAVKEPPNKMNKYVKKDIPPPPSFTNKPKASPRLHRRANGQQITAPWYHGQINNETAKARLCGKCTGSFLVRDSSDKSAVNHKYTLELLDSETVRRLKILQTDSKYHLQDTNNKKFDSVERLVEAALKTGLEVRNNTSSGQWRTISIKPAQKP